MPKVCAYCGGYQPSSELTTMVPKGMKFGPQSLEHRKAISDAKKGKKGKPLSDKERSRVTAFFQDLGKERTGKKRPPEDGRAISAGKKGIATSVGSVNGNWSGDDVQYPGIHQWLRKHFGAPQECQNDNCIGRSNNFDWAKRRDCEYQRRRENFLRLCRSCHRKYDRDPNYQIRIRDLLDIRELLMNPPLRNYGDARSASAPCTCGKTNSLCLVHTSYGMLHGQ